MILVKQPLISVIVPIYNIENYLKKCLDSVLQQSYRNLEIILVDDGSTDNCGVMCDQAKSADARVRTVHKKNGGLSDAKNAGIRAAKGEYLAFVDGDDYVHKDFIKTLLATAAKHKADICACSFYSVFPDGKRQWLNKQKKFAAFSNIQAIKDILLPPSLCEVVSWNKLYKKSLFSANHIEFPVGKIHEDVFTTYKLFYASNKVVFTDKTLYFYVQRDSSIKGVGFSRKNLAKLEACDNIINWVNTNNLPLKDEADYYRIFSTLDLLDKMAGDNNYKKEWDELVQWISHRKNQVLFHNSYVSPLQKAKICAVLAGRRPYILARWAWSSR